MKYMTVSNGQEKFKISKLTLGSIYFGTTIPDSESFYMMDIFLDEGGISIDTARCYADWMPGGTYSSENAIGRWIRQGGRRNRVFIGTKGGNTKAGVNPYRADLSPKGLTGELDGSLCSLQTDYVDLYWLHRDDPRIPVGEIVELANDFVRQGKVRFLGVSNWSGERFLEANRYAAEHQLCPFVMNQIQFSLAETTAERSGDSTIVCMDGKKEKWYHEHKIPIAAFTAQGQGFYTKFLNGGAENLNEEIRKKYYYGENIRRIERIKKVSEETGYTVSQIVLAYLECNEIEVTALLGNRTRTQLRDSLSAADAELTREQLHYLRDGVADGTNRTDG